jgi:hypothetical protein
MFSRQGDNTLAAVYYLFDHFVNHCSPAYLNDIRRIETFDDTTKPPTEQVVLERLLSPSLVRFCREYPKATVILRFAWEYHQVRPLYLAKALKRPNPFPRETGGHSGGLAHAMVQHFQVHDCPANLRFSCASWFDAKDTQIDVTAFLELEDEEEEYQEEDKDAYWTRYKRRMQEWTDMIKRVHENGI